MLGRNYNRVGPSSQFGSSVHVQFVAVSIVVLLFGSSVNAQLTWRRAYGAFANEDCMAVRVRSDNEFLSVGSTGSFGSGSSDIYLFAVDGDGVRLWSRTIGGSEIEYATDMVVAADGSLYVVGSTNEGAGYYNGLALHLNDQGELLWQRTYGGDDWDFFHSVKLLNNGDLLIAGQSYTGSDLSAEGWLLHLDQDGEVIWSSTIGGEGDQVAYSASPTQDGGFVLCGSSTTTDRELDAWVVKYDALGAEEWSGLYGGDSLDIARDIIQTMDGGFSLVGTTRSYASFNEAYHLKLASDGAQDWFRNWGQVSDQEAYEHIQIPSGEYLLAGYTTTSGGGGKDMILQKVGTNGDYIFGRTYGGGGDDSGYSLSITTTGYLCGGVTDGYGAGGNDVFLVRSDLEGTTEFQFVSTSFDPISVEELEGERKYPLIHPNPCNGVFSIRSERSIAHVRVFDGTGRIVLDQAPATGQQEFELDVPAGLYTVLWTDRTGVLSRAPLVVE